MVIIWVCCGYHVVGYRFYIGFWSVWGRFGVGEDPFPALPSWTPHCALLAGTPSKGRE